MFYFIKPPLILKKLYKQCIWSMPGSEKIIYLTFDDGPHPSITTFVLDQLKDYNAKASFFCVGKNVLAYPGIYERIMEEGHAVGNHSFNHLNGWKTADATYIADIAEAKKCINSNLYRPPYGRIRFSQLKRLPLAPFNLQTIMWSVLSGDFDEKITAAHCLRNIIRTARPGSIVVFHDSEKANERMRYALPEVLKYYTNKGYHFEKLNL